AREAGKAAEAVGGRSRVDPAVVVRIEQQSLADLAQVAAAFDAIGPLLGGAKSGHENTDEQGDDADDDQQLDKGECPRRLLREWRTRWSAPATIVQRHKTLLSVRAESPRANVAGKNRVKSTGKKDE